MGITLVTSSQVSHIKSSLKDLVLLYSPTKLVLLGSTNISLNITSGEKMKMEEERIEAEKLWVKEEAQQLALIFDTVGAFKVKRKDLVDIIKAQLQRDVDKRIFCLPDIQEIGEYVVELKLYPNVTAGVSVIVYAN
ncbi:hypothetical protein UlMin_027883 [Ulmus minor]